MSNQIAETILKQMGGSGRLSAMVGANNFLAGGNTLSFKFKGCRKVSYCKVTLNSTDTYDVEFFKVVKWNITNAIKIEGVYNDQLKEVFQNTTGLYLSL